jgi:hypothetical protein
VLVGTGHPLSKVRVLVDRQVVDTIVVDSDGAWILPVQMVEPGEHSITIQGLQLPEVAELEIAVSSQTYTLIIAEEEPSSETETDAPTFEIETGVEFPAGEVTISGTGQPGSALRVLLDDDEVDATVVDPDGLWSLTILIEEPGEHQLIAQELDDSGMVTGASEPVTLIITVQ